MSVKHNYEAWYPELPDLLFGRVMGVDVFNATQFLTSRCESINQDEVNIDDFKSQNAVVLNSYAKKLQLGGVDQLFLIDDNGDTVINAYIAFSFVSYAQPQFVIYMHDRMHELFTKGVLTSDSYLASEAKERLSKTILKELAS